MESGLEMPLVEGKKMIMRKETLGKRLHVENSELHEDEEKEWQEAKKIRIDKGEISADGLCRAARSSFLSLDLEVEIETALSSPKKDDSSACNNNNDERLGPANRQFPRRIESGLFSQIPSELVFHILKFLSYEILYAVGIEVFCHLRNLENVCGRSFTSSVMEKTWESFVANCPPEFK